MIDTPILRHHVEGRRHDRLQRSRHRPAGGHPARVGAELEAAHAALLLAGQLPRALPAGVTGVASGSFIAPDHEYPSYLELELTATDSANLTHTVVRRLDPQTTTVTLASSTPGLQLSVGAGHRHHAVQRHPHQELGDDDQRGHAADVRRDELHASRPGPTAASRRMSSTRRWRPRPTRPATPRPRALQRQLRLHVHRWCADVHAGEYDGVGVDGDDAFQQISTPFPVKLYGGSYSTAWVDTNGLVSFQALGQGAYGHSCDSVDGW